MHDKYHICLSNEAVCLRRSFWFPPWTVNWAGIRADAVGLVRRLLRSFRTNMMEAGGGMMKAELERRVRIPDLFWG